MKGTNAYREFMTNPWTPTRAAFKAGGPNAAMRIFVDGLFGAGRFESLPPPTSAAIMQNARAMEALALSSDPFPNLPKDEVRKLRIPTQILTGADTITLHKLVNEELARLIPGARHVLIVNASHSIAATIRQAFNSNVVNFLQVRSSTHSATLKKMRPRMSWQRGLS